MYLGQEPPGTTLKLFAPDIVSNKEHHEFSCTFSSDGKEFYFNRNMQIIVCKWEEGSWTVPELVKFTGNYRDYEAYITHDNGILWDL